MKKKTGELRMVVGYRALNKLTIKNRYPLPRVDDLFDKLHGAKYFSSLDAASGFHQILLKPEDRPKTAFRTPFGHYQFKVLPFGLTNAPATFQTVMNELFNPPHFDRNGRQHTGPILSDFLLVFIDDILVFSKTAKEHANTWKLCLNCYAMKNCKSNPPNVPGDRQNCRTLVSLWGGMESNLIPKRLKL